MSTAVKTQLDDVRGEALHNSVADTSLEEKAETLGDTMGVMKS